MPSASVITTPIVKPGDHRNPRAASRTSAQSCSSDVSQPTSCTRSRIASGLPRLARAARVASVRFSPAAILASIVRVEVGAQLVVQVGVVAAAADERAETGHQAPDDVS